MSTINRYGADAGGREVPEGGVPAAAAAAGGPLLALLRPTLQDHRASQIQDQMSLVQRELAALTMVEMKKRDLKVGSPVRLVVF